MNGSGHLKLDKSDDPALTLIMDPPNFDRLILSSCLLGALVAVWPRYCAI